MKDNVLFIAYYFPPIGGSGVQRSLKYVKYMRDFGYEPIVVTVKNGHNFSYDYEMIKEIPEGIKIYRSNSGEKLWLRSIIEKTNSKVYKIKNSLSKKQDSKLITEKVNSKDDNIDESIKDKVFRWLEYNYYVPDTKIRWYKHAIKDIFNRAIKDNDIKVIYSTSSPYTDHIIAMNIKKQTNLPWVADFRDPWIGNKIIMGRYDENRIKKEEKLEYEVVSSADMVINVSEPITEMYKKRYPQFENKFITITNGFDKEDNKNIKSLPDNKFKMSYTGVLFEGEKPETLIDILEEICNENNEFKKDLKLTFTGSVSEGVKLQLKASKISNNIIIDDYVEHQKAVKIMAEANLNILLLPDDEEGKWIFSGKIFDYMLAERPILAIVHEEGVAAKVINEKEIGFACGHHNKEKAKEYILHIYKRFKNGEDLSTGSINKCSEFERRNLTEKLTQCFDKLLNE